MKSMKFALSSAILALLAATPALSAKIEWDRSVATTDKTQFIDGDIVLALNGGDDVVIRNAGRDGQTTYRFVGATYQSLNYAPGARSRTSSVAGSETTGDANFDTLINSFTWTANNRQTGTHTLTGLTPGAAYRVQLFYNDQRYDREMSYSSDQGSDAITLVSGGLGWGQNVTGTFVADGTTQIITHATNGFANPHLTAILVTKVADTIVWNEPADTTGKSQLVSGTPLLLANGGPQTVVDNLGADGDRTMAFATELHSDLNFQPPLASINFEEFNVDTGDLAFDMLLSGFSYSTGNNDTALHTITGLQPGQRYNYQFFYYDPRPCCSNRAMILSDSNAPNDTVSVSAIGSTGSYGQNVTGQFVANGTAKTIRHQTNGFANIHYSAIVVTEANDGPIASLYGDTFTTTRQFKIFPTFSEDVTGFSVDDIEISGGSVVSLSGDGRYYTAVVEVDGTEDLEIYVRAGRVFADTLPDSNRQSNRLFVENRAFSGEAWVIEGQAGWEQAANNATNLNVENGMLVPTGDTAKFVSTAQRFTTPQRADTVIIEQSSVWDNWIPVSNVGPTGARDAPVLLSVEDGNYYFLARRGNDENYSAWHSPNMVNWTLRGAVTPPGDGRWVTSAEMKDGQFYIYADVPNDQDPHVFIDDNLDDGIAGIAGGPALAKQTCGSDAAFFRNDSDGLFHVIYEDWTPIEARTHSWDSPLAGHASSPDGVNGFVAGEHRPPIDLRTEPTGVISSYAHPQIGTCTYEVHSEGQDAFGDWTAIKVGQQYFLFADYDEHNSGIRVGRFTSDSINEDFEFVGELGDGHPDPTVGFAEGQFYLITQQSTDYVSPGPWVDGVEVRVRIDTNNDGTLNYVSPWEVVSESYDHKDGYARVVEKTPAALDLSDMPAGYAFQLQIRVDDTVVPNVTPLITRSEMRFE